jgi:hypothetical protein
LRKNINKTKTPVDSKKKFVKMSFNGSEIKKDKIFIQDRYSRFPIFAIGSERFMPSFRKTSSSVVGKSYLPKE